MEQPNLLTRSDTMFGVCQAIGEDFGFNANWLRVALAAGLFFNPVAVIGAYVAMGATVAFSRWMAPRPIAAEAVVEPVTIAVEEREVEQMALAA